MKRLIAAPLILSACVQTDIVSSEPVRLTAAQVAQIEATVTRDFYDPEAARFRDIRAVNATVGGGQTVTRVCGLVNGKNRYGAYTGYEMFGGRIENGRFVQVDFFGPCE